jgi:hypothetical protein
LQERENVRKCTEALTALTGSVFGNCRIEFGFKNISESSADVKRMRNTNLRYRSAVGRGKRAKTGQGFRTGRIVEKKKSPPFAEKQSAKGQATLAMSVYILSGKRAPPARPAFRYDLDTADFVKHVPRFQVSITGAVHRLP